MRSLITGRPLANGVTVDIDSLTIGGTVSSVSWPRIDRENVTFHVASDEDVEVQVRYVGALGWTTDTQVPARTVTGGTEERIEAAFGSSEYSLRISNSSGSPATISVKATWSGGGA